MSELSPATRALLDLLKRLPEPGAALGERVAFLREKARVHRLIADEYDTAAGVSESAEYAREQARQARELAARAEQLANEWEQEGGEST